MAWARMRRWLARQVFTEFPALEREREAQAHERLKRKLKRCGRDVCFYGHVHITGPKQVEIGDNVHIGNNAFIRAEGGLVIGDHAHISRNFLLYTISHRTNGDRIPYDEGWVEKPVHIGANVWIGMNVTVAPGTRIGDGAIIGMGTTVAGEVPPMAIVVGAQWRIVGYRDDAHYRRCLEQGAFGAVDGVPYEPGRGSAAGGA
jgi:acetyltransferase-like isoleucine patch superfamily enzyme